MKVLSMRKPNGAMTLLEVLVVIATLAVLIAFLLPPMSRPAPAMPIICMKHLRQIDIAFIMYADENKGRMPIQVSTNDDGTMEYLSHNQTFPHYQKIASYLPVPALLLCPADKNRRTAANFQQLTDTNLSYFLNADVSTDSPSTSILAGDRNLQTNGKAVSSGLFTLTTNLDMSWTSELHPNLGNIAFADGHVELCLTKNLNNVVRHQKVAVNRLSIP